MSPSYSELRKAIQELNIRKKRCEQSTHLYRVNNAWTEDYFRNSERRDWLREVRVFANHVRELGEPVLYLDVCGNTSATGMGFDHSYQVSMSTNEWSFVKRGVTSYRRDIFDKKALSDCIADIRERQGQLSLTTFRPIVGLSRYNPLTIDEDVYKDLVYRRLYQQLALVVKNTRVGGYIYLERPFQMDESIGEWICRIKPNKMISHTTTLRWARQLKCSVKMTRGIGGHKWLLRKDYKELGPIP